MKLNKTLIVAAMMAGVMCAGGLAAQGEDATNIPPPTAQPPVRPTTRGRVNFDMISTRLGLTEEQKTKAEPVFEEMAQRMIALRREPNLDAPERMAKVMEFRKDATAKLKEILTPTQMEKWERMGPHPRAHHEATAPATNSVAKP